MTTLQKSVIGAALAVAVGAGIYEAQRASSLQEQIQTLQRQPPPAAGQNNALQQQLDEANRQLAALQTENEKLRHDAADVARLRAEVARLRDMATPSNIDPTASAAKSWLARASQLKERLQETPAAKIPEFQYLTEKDWLSAAKGALNKDEDYRRALSGLRDAAESTFVETALKPALNQYARANSGQFPTDISQLQSYFNPPVDDSILQRWEVAPKFVVSSVGVGDSIITQVTPVDADRDTRFVIGTNGSGSTGGSYAWNTAIPNVEAIMAPVVKAYMAANNGLQPTDPSQLLPFAKTPEQQTALQKVIGQ